MTPRVSSSKRCANRDHGGRARTNVRPVSEIAAKPRDSATAAAAGGKILPPERHLRQRYTGWWPVYPAGWHGACLFMDTMRTAPNFRRATSIRRVALIALALTPLLAAAQVFDPQDTVRLEALARSEAALQFPQLTDRQRFLVGPIEAHLQQEKCSRPIRPLVASPQHMKDRVVIELRCQDPKPWHIYVPVRIVGTSAVAVAAHAIVAGTVIKDTDVKTEQHDISELPLGFLDDPSIAIGLTASRPIAGGAYLTNQQLVAAKAVQRGQSVTLIADAGGMSVRMAGRALSDGLMNQRVRVQNLSSGKIVEGIARSEQTVEIIVQ
jgi:flagella basal body P-ring formation protein FlgA